MSSTFDNWAAVILAAGQGKRMRSSLPKVLHPLAGWPMVRYVLEAARTAGFQRCVVVVGPDAGAVRDALGDGVEYVEQAEPLGTGHAVTQTQDAVDGAEHLLVLNGDVPLITEGTLARLAMAHQQQQADLTFLTAQMEDLGAYGRVLRDDDGRVTDVVEAAERAGIAAGPAEINAGQYCFRAGWLWPKLQGLPQSDNGEYFLTSLVSAAVRESAALVPVSAEPDEVRGINDRAQLAEVEALMRRRINRRHLSAGVSITDPATTYIDAGVSVGAETLIEPNTQLRGSTAVGEGCRIGPNATVRDSRIGQGCRVEASTVEEATLESDVEVGPYSHLRPGAHLGPGVHIGNFAEVKNARLGRSVKMGHFSYIGDADVGDETNIGAGTITCNFDGIEKHRTVVGKRVFIGSDTMLVAPVTVGDGARTGAGSVVNKDVPPDALAVGSPARIMRARRESGTE